MVKLRNMLKDSCTDFEIIRHEKPILTVKDAEMYFDTTKAAPVFIVNTEKGLHNLILSATNGKIDFKTLGTKLGFSKFKLADRKEIFDTTGYEIGEIPLIGLTLPCIFDRKLLNFDYIYGGSGDKYYTLKIKPEDLIKLHSNIIIIDI